MKNKAYSQNDEINGNVNHINVCYLQSLPITFKYDVNLKQIKIFLVYSTVHVLLPFRILFILFQWDPCFLYCLNRYILPLYPQYCGVKHQVTKIRSYFFFYHYLNVLCLNYIHKFVYFFKLYYQERMNAKQFLEGQK